MKKGGGSYEVWFLRYKTLQTGFFIILGHFLLFDPPNKLNNQNFEKMKKWPEEIIILHLCTTNDNHIMHGSWDLEHKRLIFLLFLPFYPLKSWKIKILKKWKKHLEISSFYTFVPKIRSKDVCFRRYGMWQTQFYCHFGQFFALLAQ